MTTQTVRQFVTPARGVGRVDYTKAIEYAVQPTAKGHMAFYTFAHVLAGLATLPYPVAYSATLRFYDENYNLVVAAPRVPYILYGFSTTTNRNALTLVELIQYANYADWMAFIMEEYHGANYGYTTASLTFSAGLKTKEGRYYDLNFVQWSAEPTFNAQVAGNGIWEEIVR